MNQNKDRISRPDLQRAAAIADFRTRAETAVTSCFVETPTWKRARKVFSEFENLTLKEFCNQYAPRGLRIEFFDERRADNIEVADAVVEAANALR